MLTLFSFIINNNMPKLRSLFFLVLLGFALPAAADSAPDTRISLGMTPVERAQFLSEMQQMLGSIQGVLHGIATEDRTLIAAAAARSGNVMARATPDSLRQRLPEGFKKLGGPTHLLFEELVVRAETDDLRDLLQHTANLMQQCMQCHAQFRAN